MFFEQFRFSAPERAPSEAKRCLGRQAVGGGSRSPGKPPEWVRPSKTSAPSLRGRLEPSGGGLNPNTCR